MADKTNPRLAQTANASTFTPEFSAAVELAAIQLKGPLNYEKSATDKGFKDPQIAPDDLVTYKEYLIGNAAGEAGLKNPSIKVTKAMVETQMKDPAFAEKSLRQFKAWSASIAGKENPAQPENTSTAADQSPKPVNMNNFAKQKLAQIKEKFPAQIEAIKDAKLKQKIDASLQWQEAGAGTPTTAPLPINVLLELEKLTNPTAPKTGKRR